MQRSKAWKVAIGLQDVDGLMTSEYLLETAKEHIEGNIGIDAAQERIRTYYQERESRKILDEDATNTKEADIVSSRITALLGEDTFQFSPAEWQIIHRRLFTGLLEHAGEFRTYNISKKEWVLDGKSVIYASWESIKATLDYDFDMEKQFVYDDLPLQEAVRHIAKFTSDIWQIHPFGEGNTRSTAVFMIKYLKTFGFPVSNDVFAENAWYFRNALVRANYNDYTQNISATTEFLERFYENMLMGAEYDLKNRNLHIQSAIAKAPKCQNGTLECTLEELAVLDHIKNNPHITQKELAEKTGKSERTIKRLTVSMQEKGLIVRQGGRRNGRWEIT
ncbi:MAG: Fic family protein [Bacillota bacterium]|nr:Fic family protein [Bacillota bacterium]